MVNKNVFNTGCKIVAEPDIRNQAGGKAYKLSDEAALAQYTVTGTFNNSFYAGAADQLKEVKRLVANCSSKFIAKCALYGHTQAHMKDVPAYLCAVLAARTDGLDYLRRIFPQVIKNGKMLRNFVQIIRSGEVGRKSFGTAIKGLIRDWFAARNGRSLFLSSIGQNPSMADVIKMVHPRPVSVEQDALFAYFLGKSGKEKDYPQVVKEFEAFKSDKRHKLPDIPFQFLSNIEMTEQNWRQVARNMPWNTLRMNLNQLARHKVFDDRESLDFVANKLMDEEQISKFNAFPYQIYNTLKNVDGLPQKIQNALQHALNVAVDNAPVFSGKIAVAIDTSGSMHSPVSGYRGGATSTAKMNEVAALFGMSLLRKNMDDTLILPFDSVLHDVKLNPMDSVSTNIQKLGSFCGGTNMALPLAKLNRMNWKGDAVVYFSDMQSWIDSSGYYSGLWGNTRSEWTKLKNRSRRTKLIYCNLNHYGNTQLPPGQPDVLNVGGWSDSVYKIIVNFMENSDKDFLSVINEVEL